MELFQVRVQQAYGTSVSRSYPQDYLPRPGLGERQPTEGSEVADCVAEGVGFLFVLGEVAMTKCNNTIV